MTVTNKPIAGSAKETVKTIAQGKLDDSGEPVVTTLVCLFHLAREAAGATGTRLSLRPLISRAGGSRKTRAEICGEIAKLWLLLFLKLYRIP